MYWQLICNGIISGTLLAVLAIGYALVYNITRIFHIAYAVLFIVAPYFVLALNNAGINIFFEAIIALVGTAVLSIIMELLIYRPLKNKNSSLNVYLISSVGFMIVIINLIALIFGNETKIIRRGISNSVEFGSVLLTNTQLLQFGVSACLILIFLLFLKFTKFGLTTRALRDDEYLCSLFAVDIKKLRIYIFALSGLFAAIAGILSAYDVGMTPYIGMPMLLNAIVALIIGGIGKFHTAIYGAFIIGILQALTVGFFSANWKEAVTFVVLVIFLLIRPQGIFGEKQRIV